MKRIWRTTLFNWFFGLILCVIAGSVIGHLLLTLLLYTLGSLGWQFYHIYKFHHWLRYSGRTSPPNVNGIWEEVFDAVYRLQKKQRKSKRKMHQALTRIERSTAALKEGVIMADNQGNLEWWNNSAGHFFGLMRPVDRGQMITNIVRHPDFFRYFTQKRFGEPLVIKSPAKEGMFLEIQTTLYDKNDHLIFIRDVTRLHLLEEMRKDFVANASHELKTPLTVIKGYLETLGMFQDALPKSMQKGIVNMSEQSERMEQLIEDLLLLSRLESNNKNKENQWHKVSDLIHAIHKNIEPILTPEHQVNIDIADNARLYGSYQELYSAFSNLMVNAVKYSPNGGAIDIKWEGNDLNGVLSVKDSGLGIDPKYIPRLTERFFRVDKGRGSKTGGTGLGLAIVKHVLLLHDARLQIRSKLSYGSTFSCYFPGNRITFNPIAKQQSTSISKK